MNEFLRGDNTWVPYAATCCPKCGKPYFMNGTARLQQNPDGTYTYYVEGTCQCSVPTITISTTSTLVSPETHGNTDDDDDEPGILSDIPAMIARAEQVRSRARHKDLDGETAQLLAADVLALCEVLKEAYDE